MTTKKIPNYLGTSGRPGLLETIKVNGHHVVPLAVTDLNVSFAVADAQGRFCGKASMPFLQATNAGIHRQVTDIIEAVREGRVVPRDPEAAFESPPSLSLESPLRTEPVSIKTPTLSDLEELSLMLTKNITQLVEAGELQNVTLRGLMANQTRDKAAIDDLHCRVTALELARTSLVVQEKRPSLVERLRKMFKTKREG